MNHNFQDNDFDSEKIIVTLNKAFNHYDEYKNDIIKILNIDNFAQAKLLFHSTKSQVGDVLLIYLTSKNKADVINTISILSKNPNIIVVEPDYLYDEYIISNDEYFEYLWGLKKINAPLAWNYCRGVCRTVVGVLDSGVDYTHPDLKNNMWVSRNRYYRNGWNFVDNNGNPMDQTDHGTHVAGTIGAIGNNCISITGVCWNVQIAAFKIGNQRIDLAAAIAAIYFANLYHIPILNNSWGGRAYSPILKYAIEQYNGLFIASAGNSGTDNDFIPSYPASYDSENIISVAASTPNDDLASFSNYGSTSVDIAAPGTRILSTTLNGEYSYKNGTSMAAPHVVGAAALLKSCRPCLSTLEMKNIILNSAQQKGTLKGKILTGGILDVNAMLAGI